MDQATWTAVDEYLNAKLVGSDASLEAALRLNTEAHLPAFDVAPNQGKLLNLLIRISGAKRVLEIGTLGGYSTIWLARAVAEGGTLVTLESEPKHAEVAARNVREADLETVIEIRVGPALRTLEELYDQGVLPFDFIFIDADKPNNPAYLSWAIKLSRPGTVIIADNVIRDGAIINHDSTDPRVRGVQTFFDDVAGNKRITATAVQTVGSKGYDGFMLALVESVSST